MVATKDQERKALGKIRQIIDEIGGEDSYIGMALDGSLELAAENIENDFGDSWMLRWSAAIKENETARKELKEAKEETEAIAKELETMTASREHWKNVSDQWKESADKNYNKMIEAITESDTANQTIKAQEAEIITLKAKLYDLMTA